MRRLWRDHSLSIVMGVIGFVAIVIAFCFPQGRIFDLFLTLGGGILTVTLINILSGTFRERNKPED